MAKVGFEDLTGIDYAIEAIELAKCIAKNNNVDINLKALDFLNSSEPSNSGILNQTFDIIIDKGTYDAVCLNPTNVTEKRQQYLKQVQQLLSTEGFFLLFSCNWTKEELLSSFIGFKLYDEIKIPSIGFGGKTGQTVTA
ncbi:Methyltransferase-like protein 10, partial [Stegodyphus mimosarum]